jgi:hypothetical protein
MALITKTILLIGLSLFYSIIFVFMGFYDTNSTIVGPDIPTSGTTTTIQDCDCGTLTCSELALLHGQKAVDDMCSQQVDTPKIWSIDNAISTISILPWWANTIIFAPLLIGLSFILLTSFIPFLSGGE